MYLRNLIVENFGVFDGLHEFELAPLPASADNNRHLTVISGHNGAGKSTLFQAMRLALYGSLALGDRVSQQDYNRYLADRLHHRKGHPMADEARVGLTYLYVQSGQSMGIEVERRWKRKGRTLIETLDVRRNGEPLDMPSADYQAWLLELVPRDWRLFVSSTLSAWMNWPTRSFITVNWENPCGVCWGWTWWSGCGPTWNS